MTNLELVMITESTRECLLIVRSMLECLSTWIGTISLNGFQQYLLVGQLIKSRHSGESMQMVFQMEMPSVDLK